jgi:hypothetical protein
MYEVAVGMVANRERRQDVREIAFDALEHPSPSTVRNLVSVGRGQEWLPSVIDALAQVGIAAIEDVIAPVDEQRGLK